MRQVVWSSSQSNINALCSPWDKPGGGRLASGHGPSSTLLWSFCLETNTSRLLFHSHLFTHTPVFVWWLNFWRVAEDMPLTRTFLIAFIHEHIKNAPWISFLSPSPSWHAAAANHARGQGPSPDAWRMCWSSQEDSRPHCPTRASKGDQALVSSRKDWLHGANSTRSHDGTWHLICQPSWMACSTRSLTKGRTVSVNQQEKCSCTQWYSAQRCSGQRFRKKSIRTKIHVHNDTAHEGAVDYGAVESQSAAKMFTYTTIQHITV